MHVVVASANQAKVRAVRQAFQEMFGSEGLECQGVDAKSGVPDQPHGEAETLQGALNRVQYVREIAPKADYWVGLEGGIEIADGQTSVFAWMVVQSADGRLGKGRTGTFSLPPAFTKLILEGKELGEVADIVFAAHNSKHSTGAVGLLTHGVMNRDDYYVHALVLALIPFRNPDLY